MLREEEGVNKGEFVLCGLDWEVNGLDEGLMVKSGDVEGLLLICWVILFRGGYLCI